MSDRKSDEITFYDLALFAIRKWWIGVLCMGLAVGLALWLAITGQPIYRAEATLILAQPPDQSESGLSGQLGSLAALAGVSLRGSSDRKSEAIATMQSRTLTDSFVKDNNLLPVLFASRWDQATQQWKPDVKVPTLWDANKLITRDVRKVVEDRKTGLITLAVEWSDPELAAAWAFDLVERTNKLLQQSAYERSTRNIEYLKKQLEQTNIIEVRQAIYKLMESELKTSMLAQRSEDYAFKVLDSAVVPEEKVRPRRVLIVALGIVAGMFLWIVSLVVYQVIANLVLEHRRATGAAAGR